MNEKLKEIVDKYGLSREEVNQGIDQLCKGGLGKITNVSCKLAFAEVLTMLEMAAPKGE